MTASALTSSIDARRERIRELTETEQQLEQSLAKQKTAIATAVARGGNDDATGIRDSVRSDSDRLAEIRSALEMLNRDRSSLEAQLKKAEAREATERANQSAAGALSAIDTFRGIIYDAADKILAAERIARRAVDQANSDNSNALSLNGSAVSGFPRVHYPPGLHDLVRSLDSYVHRQEVNPAPASHARVA